MHKFKFPQKLINLCLLSTMRCIYTKYIFTIKNKIASQKISNIYRSKYKHIITLIYNKYNNFIQRIWTITEQLPE